MRPVGRASALQGLLLFVALLSGCGAHQIEHVVVAMLENRAFDHMLGWVTQRLASAFSASAGSGCSDPPLVMQLDVTRWALW